MGGQRILSGRLPGPEVDALTVGKRLGVQISAHSNGFAVGVYAHLTEIEPEPGLHEGAHIVGQGASFAFAVVNLCLP
jgi:hypothetical protein